MGYVVMLLGLQFYIFAAASVFFFGKNDPMHFGNLENAMLSLFRGATMEDWTDLMYIQMYGSEEYGYGAYTWDATTQMASFDGVDYRIIMESGYVVPEHYESLPEVEKHEYSIYGNDRFGWWAAGFFSFFVVTGSLIILNLFIGVIMNGMDEMKEEAEMEALAKEREKEEGLSVDKEIDLIDQQLKDVSTALKLLKIRIDPEKRKQLEDSMK